jgi:hypothetical protein
MPIPLANAVKIFYSLWHLPDVPANCCVADKNAFALKASLYKAHRRLALPQVVKLNTLFCLLVHAVFSLLVFSSLSSREIN